MTKKIAIIGAGISGTLVALNIIRAEANFSGQIFLIEKDEEQFFTGVAYRNQSPKHLLNVRAAKMSLLREDPEHFIKWLQANKLPYTASDFVPRKIYGEYITSTAKEIISRINPEKLEAVHAEVLDITKNKDNFSVALANGRTLEATAVIIASGNLPPSTPSALINLKCHPELYYENPWNLELTPDILQCPAICLIGTGLTAIDIITNLHSKNYAGKIVMISRRGLLPQPHFNYTPEKEIVFPNFSGTLSQKLRQVRQWLASAKNWQAYFDALRPQTSTLWKSLSTSEKRRFLQHIRPYWDTHRHRIAPELYSILQNKLATGQLEIYAGRITKSEVVDQKVILTFQEKCSQKTKQILGSKIINCTGPDRISATASQLLKNILAKEFYELDSLQLGLTSLTANQTPQNLYILGSLRKGELWESTALNEIKEQAFEIAAQITSQEN